MTRTIRALLLAAFLASTVFAGGSAPALADAQPDIVVVMVDDLGYIPDERILERLPNIRNLFIDGGLRFDSYYGELPWCCPGRASFLTGQHVRNHHVTHLDARLLDPSQTVATALQAAGYATRLYGKYLNKSRLLADQTPVGWSRPFISHDQNGPAWSLNGTQAVRYGSRDRVLSDLLMADLADHPLPSAKPAFLFVTPHAPHQIGGYPYLDQVVEGRFKGDPRCAGIEPWNPPSYDWPAQPAGWGMVKICQAMLTTDELVGKLQTKLAQRGRPTVWVLTSDNGMAWGVKGWPQKNVPEASQMPLYFAGSGIVPGASSALLSNIDLGPTIAELGGASMPWADGSPFADLLSGGTGGDEWILEDHPEGGDKGEPSYWGIRTTSWHLIARGDQPVELYDLGADPWETNNVADARPDVLGQLQAYQP